MVTNFSFQPLAQPRFDPAALTTRLGLQLGTQGLPPSAFPSRAAVPASALQALAGALLLSRGLSDQKTRREQITDTLNKALNAGTTAAPVVDPGVAGPARATAATAAAAAPRQGQFDVQQAFRILAQNPDLAPMAARLRLSQALNQSNRAGQTRQVLKGNKIVTEERQPDGTFKVIGEAPRFRPRVGAARMTTLSPEQAKALGFKPGAVVQRNTRTGGLSVVRRGDTPARRLLTADELKAGGFPADAIVERGSDGALKVLRKGSAATTQKRVLSPDELAARGFQRDAIVEVAPDGGLKVLRKGTGRNVRLLTGSELEMRGFPGDALVELRPDGSIKVVRKGTAPRSQNPRIASELRRQSDRMFEGQINDVTGQFSFKNPNDALVSQRIQATAKQLLDTNPQMNIAQSVLEARKQLGIGARAAPAVAVPQKQRDALLAQNNEIKNIRSIAVKTLPKIRLGTGAASNITALAEATAGQIASLIGRDRPLFPDTAASRQAIRLFNQEVKRAVVNNRKFPVPEQKIILDMLPDPDSVFTNPAAAAQNLRQLMVFLRDKERNNAALLRGRAPSTGRVSKRRALRDARDAIRRGAPRNQVEERLRFMGIDPKEL